MLKKVIIGIGITVFTVFGVTNFPFPQQYKYQYGIMPNGISYKHVQQVYDIWLKNYYEEQGDKARIKFDNPQQTVSEGIGYGMLIMVYMDNEQNNTRPKFDKLWNYYKSYPSKDGLMHWKINGFGGVAETGSATDGDIDVALALIMAAKQWGDDKYLQGAKAMAKAIRTHCVSGNLLDGGDQWNDINPSYMSMVATQLFQEIDPEGNWAAIQSACYNHLKSNQHSTTGMWPNWTTGGVGNCPKCYGFDAARVPWRLGWAYVWYGHQDAKTCCQKIVSWFKSKTNDQPAAIGQIYNLDGSINTAAGGSNDNIPTFLGPLVVAGMVDASFQSWVDKGYSRLVTFGTSNDNYYNECLELLTMLLLTGNMPDFTKVTPKTTATLSVKVIPEGAGKVEISPQKSSYSRGESVTLKAISNDESKYSFVGWQGDYEETSPTITIKLNCDMSIIASFKDKFAMDLVDDCEDNNARTYLKTPWFTYTDKGSNGASTISPVTEGGKAFKMTEGGYNSQYAVKIEYTLNKGSFSGDPFVGVGFQLRSDGEPMDISASTGISFYYKGTFGDDTTCSVQIETSSIPVESGASYRYYLKRSTNWKEVVLLWKDFYQPKWVTNPQPLDLKTVTKIKWQIQAKSGSGELWLDDIRLPGLYIERPIPDKIISHITSGTKNSKISLVSGKNYQYLIYYNNQEGNVKIDIYSLDGRYINNIVNAIKPQGEIVSPISKSLSKGSYIIKVIDGSGRVTLKPISVY